MKIKLNEQFLSICDDIIQQGWSLDEWCARESSDMFQVGNFNGGFDATEMSFCFSYYDASKNEFWFQVTMDEIIKIKNGIITEVNGRPAE